MITRIVHYCWLSGDPYPESIQRCIDSWKRILPDYELVLWDTKRFDLSSSVWVKQAFESKKYAFAADYIRMYALYHFGGIYLDSDVEVLKPFDEAATIGSENGWPLAKLMLDRYDSKSFLGKDGHMDLRAMPYLLRRCIDSNYQYNAINSISDFDLDEKVINVFPTEYFSPKAWNNGKISITPYTYSIHHFAASWMTNPSKKKDCLTRIKEKVAYSYRKRCSLNYSDAA